MKRQGWESKVTDEGEEIVIVPIAITNLLGDFDFVVEALELASANRENSKGGEAGLVQNFL